MNDISKIIAGSDVWIVERDEECEAVEVTCFMFLAKAEDYVICSSFVLGHDYSANTTLEYHANETRENYDTQLCVFPAEDCYETREEAKKAYALETGECEDE